MSDAVSFRPMTEADLDAVLKIEYAAYSHPWTRGIFLDGLGKYQIWLMFEGQQQVGHGVVQIILDEAHLLNITVKPENQGRGLGLTLLEHLMSIAYKADARECFWKCATATRRRSSCMSAMASTKSAVGGITTRRWAGAKMRWSWPARWLTEPVTN
jgi:ribosomal-protein-alanine N-acetyltransferase